MGQRATATCEERLEAYIDGLASVVGHANRVKPIRGLLLPGRACSTLAATNKLSVSSASDGA